jgi:putative YhbY family RNA-binding protein
MIPLSSKKRSELRAEAHKLNPLVIIGDKGLTDVVIAEIDRTLKAHELVKVRAMTDVREDRDAWLATVCERLQAHPVQQIGKVFVVYRENPKEKPQRMPSTRPAPRDSARKHGSGSATARRAPVARDEASKAAAREAKSKRTPREATGKSFGRTGDARKPPFGRTGEARKPPFGRTDEARKPPFGAAKRKPSPRDAAAPDTPRSGKGRAFAAEGAGEARGISRPRSRTPSPRPASEPPKRRPRTSR